MSERGWGGGGLIETAMVAMVIFVILNSHSHALSLAQFLELIFDLMFSFVYILFSFISSDLYQKINGCQIIIQ